LLELACDFGADQNQHLPIRKISLLLWKTIMLVHGDLARHRATSAAARKAVGLAPAPTAWCSFSGRVVKYSLFLEQALRSYAFF
jgi:hypothetical protein